MDDRSRSEEQTRLEERMCDYVEYCNFICAKSKSEEHQTKLRNGGIGEYFFDVVLYQTYCCRNQCRYSTDDGDYIIYKLNTVDVDTEKEVHSRDHKDSCRYHCCGVDQCRYRSWAGHRIGKP